MHVFYHIFIRNEYECNISMKIVNSVAVVAFFGPLFLSKRCYVIYAGLEICVDSSVSAYSVRV